MFHRRNPRGSVDASAFSDIGVGVSSLSLIIRGSYTHNGDEKAFRVATDLANVGAHETIVLWAGEDPIEVAEVAAGSETAFHSAEDGPVEVEFDLTFMQARPF